MMHAAIDLLIIVIDCIYDDDVQKKIKSKKLTKTPKFPISSTQHKFQVSSCIHRQTTVYRPTKQHKPSTR